MFTLTRFDGFTLHAADSWRAPTAVWSCRLCVRIAVATGPDAVTKVARTNRVIRANRFVTFITTARLRTQLQPVIAVLDDDPKMIGARGGVQVIVPS